MVRYLNRLCFIKGTPVHTKEGVKPIEEIKVGDLVASKNDITGELDWKPVVQLFRNNDKEVLHVSFENNEGELESIGVTAEHPFYVENVGWTNAGNLNIGDKVTTMENDVAVVTKIKIDEEKQTTYNFEVEDFHTYFVGELGLWVHNMCAARGLVRTVDSLGVDDIIAINRRFSDGAPMDGKDVSTVLANAFRREGPINQAASAIRDIAGGHLFRNGNKRTAQALVESLNLPGVSSARIRGVIDQVSTGGLREIDDIARALGGG